MVYLLLPRFGMNGFLFVIFASKLINTFLSIYQITNIANFKIKYLDWVLKPFVCSYISVVFSKFLVNSLFNGYRYSPFMLISYVGVSILIYIILIFAFQCVKKQWLFSFEKSLLLVFLKIWKYNSTSHYAHNDYLLTFLKNKKYMRTMLITKS